MPDQTTPTVCTFESRRAEEMRSLIERHGGAAVVAPSMKEVPLQQNTEAMEGVRRMLAGDVDYLILLTGVGTEALVKLAASQQLDQPLLQAMKTIPPLVRGPKPAAVLKKLGLTYAVRAPEPNTWNELLEAIDSAAIRLDGKMVAVQEYGIPNPELYQALQSRGAEVLPLPVYQWALPDDTGPLQFAIDRTVTGDVDILLFTSAQQVRNVLTVAEQSKQKTDWLAAAGRIIVASIGPTCTMALKEAGLKVSFEAAPPKMGPLVKGALQLYAARRS
ncbi:MAG: uroporphyrinogen-III synthase [Fuerstiella sp.]